MSRGTGQRDGVVRDPLSTPLPTIESMTMTTACRIPSPAERAFHEILSKAENKALETVVEALRDAHRTVAAGFADSGLEGVSPPYEYFVAGVHQKLYCLLCGADPQTFAGGRPETAIGIIRNSQNIARHYWGADIAPDRPS